MKNKNNDRSGNRQQSGSGSDRSRQQSQQSSDNSRQQSGSGSHKGSSGHRSSDR